MRNLAIHCVVVLVVISTAGVASAALRSPQVAITGDGLQMLLNSQGESIDAATQQQDIQVWATTTSNNSTFTLMMELSSNAAGNTIGIYNGADASPALYQLFPGAATSGWFATASFRSAPLRLVVNLFDNTGAIQGTTTYLAGPPSGSDFGFYLMGPGTGGGTLYTQDARNPGARAYALAYAATGSNAGSWWLAFEDTIGESDFCDELIFMESVNPTPVSSTTWGQLKTRFR